MDFRKVEETMKYLFASSILLFSAICLAGKCPNCNGSGKVEIMCNACQGKGFIIQNKLKKVGRNRFGLHPDRAVVPVEESCRVCTKMVAPGARGSGKVKAKCQTCNGKGSIRGNKVKQKPNQRD